MKFGGISRVTTGWAAILILCILPASNGCQRSFVLRGSCGFDWFHGDCQNCDSCRPRLLPRRMRADSCETCGERGCTRGSCRARREACAPCGGKFPCLFRAFGIGCVDPRVPKGHGHRKHGSHGNHGHHGEFYHPNDPMSPWSHDGPGSFHPVPTRPVFGAQPTPADGIPHEEDPSDAGLESIPLRDLPRNLDTPSDPRNLIPKPEDVQPNLEDYPSDASSSVLKKYPVEQTAWRARKSD